mmetsp:Transcript_74164/g.206160  ORF Transcript_74164/g.206160 Transcript_74164/m.206160 type:complete len:211 (+) Transcript_74164:308-940(+)
MPAMTLASFAFAPPWGAKRRSGTCPTLNRSSIALEGSGGTPAEASMKYPFGRRNTHATMATSPGLQHSAPLPSTRSKYRNPSSVRVNSRLPPLPTSIAASSLGRISGTTFAPACWPIWSATVAPRLDPARFTNTRREMDAHNAKPVSTPDPVREVSNVKMAIANVAAHTANALRRRGAGHLRAGNAREGMAPNMPTAGRNAWGMSALEPQ